MEDIILIGILTSKPMRNSAKGILASASMPIVWEPVERITAHSNGNPHTIDQSVDSGVRNVSPLADVITEINNDGPASDYTIFIINCNSGEVDYEQYEDANIAGIALRALNDIALTEIFNDDITEFLRINDIIGQVRSVHSTLEIRNYNLREGRTTKILRHFRAIIIQPDPAMPGGDPLVANAADPPANWRFGFGNCLGPYRHPFLSSLIPFDGVRSISDPGPVTLQRQFS